MISTLSKGSFKLVSGHVGLMVKCLTAPVIVKNTSSFTLVHSIRVFLSSDKKNQLALVHLGVILRDNCIEQTVRKFAFPCKTGSHIL